MKQGSFLSLKTQRNSSVVSVGRIFLQKQGKWGFFFICCSNASKSSFMSLCWDTVQFSWCIWITRSSSPPPFLLSLKLMGHSWFAPSNIFHLVSAEQKDINLFFLFCLSVRWLRSLHGGISRCVRCLITAEYVLAVVAVRLQEWIQTAESISGSSGNLDAVTALTASVWSLSELIVLLLIRHLRQRPPSYLNGHLSDYQRRRHSLVAHCCLNVFPMCRGSE